MEAKDIEHLEWIERRLIGTHNENPKVDYMVRLRHIILKEKAEAILAGLTEEEKAALFHVLNPSNIHSPIT